ncbi:MAG TPA: MFS transporter [Vicinamibacterales bacterium]|nr:MFS transporter [Vicinamibacterales bacterium]
MISPAQSRRNVLVAAATSFMGFAGFTVVMPFIPLYISELGVHDVGEVAMWSGLTLGATPAVTAISAPLWGRIGDRYGSKLLVLRSLGAFVLTKSAMAFVTAPWQLVALRGLLGVFAGYGALTMSMAAESVRREEMPRAIGVVQMGQRLGPAIGPLVGGVLAPMVGLRRAFLVTAAFYLAAMLVVGLLYHEPRTRVARTATRSLASVARELLATPGFLLALAVIFTLQTVDRSFSPILPLFVEQLGIAGGRVATVSGLLFSMIAVCAAIGHKAAGGLMRRWSSRTLVTSVAVTSAIALVAIVVLPSMGTLTAGLIVASLGIGIALTTAYSVAGALLPADAHVTGFGIMTTASLIGLAFSPVLAGFVGGSGLRIVFVVDVVLLVALALTLAGARRVLPNVPDVPDVPKVPQVPQVP